MTIFPNIMFCSFNIAAYSMFDTYSAKRSGPLEVLIDHSHVKILTYVMSLPCDIAVNNISTIHDISHQVHKMS